MNNKNNSFKGLGFTLKYLTKSWFTLIVVTIFIFGATWLQVKAPLIMGDAFDEVAKYVGLNIQKSTIDSNYESVMDGKGLTPEFSEALLESNKVNQETKDMITNVTNEQLKLQFELIDFQKEVFKLSSDNKLSLAQIEFINTSEQSPQIKAILLSMTEQQIIDSKELIKNLTVTDGSITSSKRTFLDIIIVLVIVYLTLSILTFIYNILMVRVAALASKRMRNDLFHKLEELSIRFFDKSSDGDVLSRFTNDIDNINTALNQSLTQVISQVAMLIAVLLMMFKEDETTFMFMGNEISNALTWQLLAFAVVAIAIALLIVQKASKHVSLQQEKLGAMNGYIDERISCQKVIISNDLGKDTIEGFEKYNKSFLTTSFKGQAYSGAIMPVMTGIGLINLGFLVFYGSQQVSEGAITVGLLTAFIQYSTRFFSPLGQIFSQYNIIQLAISGASRVKEVFDEVPEVVNNPGAVDIDGIHELVELKDVCFSYDEGKPILKNINIKVAKGKKIALVGPTGSGKTTVMNLMNRFYDITSGEILFDSRNISDITLDTLRRNVGIVLQESVLFNGTILENISYGKQNLSKDEVVSAAKTANIHDFIMSLDDGYETKINNDTTLFSVGQKQLMSIARTIITDPDLLILDEATSNVDTVTEAKIQLAMENVMKNRTSFVIAHRLKTILDADEIIVLKDGEIIEQGNHSELIKLDGFYAELYYNQFVTS